MRRLFIVMALGMSALLSGAAQAGALLNGSLSFVLGGQAPIIFTGLTSTGPSGTASETSPPTFTLMAGSAFKGTSTIMLTPTPSNPLTQIVITIMANKAGSFTGAVPSGTATVTGTALNKALGSTLLAVPIELGKTGTLMAAGSGIKVTAVGTKWTAGMTTISLGMGVTVMGTGSVMSGAPGHLKLVAASKIITNLGITTFALGVLDLEYATVPEPALPLLLIAGAATLGIVGTRKLKRN